MQAKYQKKTESQSIRDILNFNLPEAIYNFTLQELE